MVVGGREVFLTGTCGAVPRRSRYARRLGAHDLHNDYTALVDDFKSIKNLLELQETVETVETLRRGTGQTPDLFTGMEQTVRPPLTNYVIGHGKAAAAAAITCTYPAAPEAVVALVLQFAEQRPADNKKNLQGLVDKVKQVKGAEQAKKLINIVAQATAVKVFFEGFYLRDASYAQFATELKNLVNALYALADPVTAAATADTEINKVRRLLREELAAA